MGTVVRLAEALVVVVWIGLQVLLPLWETSRADSARPALVPWKTYAEPANWPVYRIETASGDIEPVVWQEYAISFARTSRSPR